MQVAIVQFGDEGLQMFFAKYVPGFHELPSKVKADILFPISCAYKLDVRLQGKGRANYFT